MADATNGTRRNQAEVRGDIEKGRTGDKVTGFDPAAAPLETDAEAGGQTLDGTAAPSGAADAPRTTQGENERAYGSAMRPFEGTEKDKGSKKGWTALALAGVVVLVVIFIALA